MTPLLCVLVSRPARAWRSSRHTDRPPRAIARALASPVTPPPITATWIASISPCYTCYCVGRSDGARDEVACAFLISVKDAMATGMFARYRQPLTLLLAAAFGWMLLALVGRVLPAGNGLVARYYADTTFSGRPVESGYDAVPSTAQIARRWRGRPPPAFSVAWTGYLTVGRADLYRFATVSDDGSRLFVD